MSMSIAKSVLRCVKISLGAWHNLAPQEDGEQNAKRTAGAETPSGRDRQRSSHCPDRDRRDRGNRVEATGQAQQRIGGGESACGEHHPRATPGDRAQGRCGKVGLMERTQPTRAMAVANWFLERSWRSADMPPCDQMKLYKLVFYAHGWYLGNNCGELFPEDVEAWPHGPFVRDLYLEFKSAGRGSITSLGTRMEIEGLKVSRTIPRHDGSLDGFFESVWNVYGGYTGIQLSNMTHREGEPWTIVAEEYGYDLSTKPTITSEIIEAAFERKVQSQQA